MPKEIVRNEPMRIILNKSSGLFWTGGGAQDFSAVPCVGLGSIRGTSRTVRAMTVILARLGVPDASNDNSLLSVGVSMPEPFPAWKRAMDVGISSVLLVLLAPLMLITAGLIALEGGSPLFAHKRIGQNGRFFYCYKFRTMFPDSQARLEQHLAQNPDARREWHETQKLRRDPRVTAIGAFLRASSIDELPQLINVLRGEMSIVGPRPIVEAESRHYGRRFGAYCRVRPGITGLWQVSGRSDLSYRRRVALDMTYIRRQSAALDIIIILKTIPAVLMSKGSY